MLLLDRIRQHGTWLFRWRSYAPLALLPLVIAALPESERMELALGEPASHAMFFACLALSYAGLALRCLIVGFVPAGTSGRNTTEQRAAHLNTSGAYSLVRHPLYVANFIILLGVMLSLLVWWLVLLLVLAYALYVERVAAAEEHFLARAFGPAYEAWARRTPAFLPRWRGWRRPQNSFSLRTVLRREYPGVLAVAVTYLVLEIWLDIFVAGEAWAAWAADDAPWLVVAGASAIVYLALRSLKKRTNVLRVAGR